MINEVPNGVRRSVRITPLTATLHSLTPTPLLFFLRNKMACRASYGAYPIVEAGQKSYVCAIVLLCIGSTIDSSISRDCCSSRSGKVREIEHGLNPEKSGKIRKHTNAGVGYAWINPAKSRYKRCFIQTILGKYGKDTTRKIPGDNPPQEKTPGDNQSTKHPLHTKCEAAETKKSGSCIVVCMAASPCKRWDWESQATLSVPG